MLKLVANLFFQQNLNTHEPLLEIEPLFSKLFESNSNQFDSLLTQAESLIPYDI